MAGSRMPGPERVDVYEVRHDDRTRQASGADGHRAVAQWVDRNHRSCPRQGDRTTDAVCDGAPIHRVVGRRATGECREPVRNPPEPRGVSNHRAIPSDDTVTKRIDQTAVDAGTNGVGGTERRPEWVVCPIRIEFEQRKVAVRRRLRPIHQCAARATVARTRIGG